MNTQSGSKASTSSPAGSIRAAGFVRTDCSRPTPGIIIYRAGHISQAKLDETVDKLVAILRQD
jgi:hypothetical protein